MPTHIPYGAIASADLTRLRRFQVILIVLHGTIGCGVLLLHESTVSARLALAGNLIAILTGIGWLKSVTREEHITLGRVIGFGLPHFIAGAMVLDYCGYFSVAPAVWLVAVHVFAMTRERSIAFFIYVSGALASGLPMILVATGVLPDHGKLSVRADPAILYYAILATQIGLLAVYRFAREGTVKLQEAVDEVERAKREVLRREALLEEANADLDRVLHARAGPATGSTMGDWELGSLLGRGGMGEVYRATHSKTGVVAAVKLLLADADVDPELAERLRREAEALARVDHPNVVRLLDVGDGWIAMEHLEGTDLAAMLRRRRVFQSKEATKLVTDVAAALEAAREARIVHRDLKPQNIFFETKTARWKVLDFGLSKLEQRNNTLTAKGAPMGTPAYMAPEQIEGGAVDHRADVFALGLVAYRAITGRPAFSADEPAAVFFNVLFEQPPQPSDLAPVDIDVDFALALALAKSPSDRFERASELADALESAFRGSLSTVLRTRAQALLAVHGWGERRLGSVRHLPTSLKRAPDPPESWPS